MISKSTLLKRCFISHLSITYSSCIICNPWHFRCFIRSKSMQKSRVMTSIRSTCVMLFWPQTIKKPLQTSKNEDLDTVRHLIMNSTSSVYSLLYGSLLWFFWRFSTTWNLWIFRSYLEIEKIYTGQQKAIITFWIESFPMNLDFSKIIMLISYAKYYDRL